MCVSPSVDRITVNQHGTAFAAHTDNAVIGQWSSQAAVIADVAAAVELREHFPEWSELSPAEIARVLMSLRIFLERCPKCDGPIQVDQEVVQSCCRSYDVIASICQECGTRLSEVEWDDTGTDESRTQSSQPT